MNCLEVTLKGSPQLYKCFHFIFWHLLNKVENEQQLVHLFHSVSFYFFYWSVGMFVLLLKVDFLFQQIFKAANENPADVMYTMRNVRVYKPWVWREDCQNNLIQPMEGEAQKTLTLVPLKWRTLRKLKKLSHLET